ncbi:MAG TPA: hypothetical protein VIK78_18245 [Ruminiclostridium sp.]
MKKFIIITVFMFLIAILISFNYLVWDREKQIESFQDISDSNNLTIDTLSEKMNNLDKLNKELETLTEDNTTTKENFSLISNENMELKKEIISKNNIIVVFKKSIDIAPMDTTIKKWVEEVNSKNYKGAEALISKNSKDATITDVVNLKEIYQSELKAIRFKTSKLFTELTDEEHIGKIQVKVVFEVDKPDSTDENKDKIPQVVFKSGDNEKYMTMELNEDTNQWLILEMTDKP